MPKPNDDLLTAYADHERTTAQRMQHWPIFLVREYRRLRAIADAVAQRGEPDPSRMAVGSDGPIRRDSPSEPVPSEEKSGTSAELEAMSMDAPKRRHVSLSHLPLSRRQRGDPES